MQQQRRNLWRWISSNQRRPLLLRYGIQPPPYMPPLIMRHFGGWYTITSQLQRCCSSTHPIPYPITGTGSNNRWKLLNSNNIPSPSVRTVQSSLLFAQLSTTTTTTTTTTTSDNNNNNNNNDTDDAVTMVHHKINPDDANHPHHNTVTIQPPPKPPINTVGLRQYMKAYSELSKLKLSSLVVATTAAGYIAAGPIPYDMNSTIFIATIFGTSFCSACASGYNQIYERQRDTLMKRTQLRPLVTGILSPSHAIVVTTTWGIIGTTTLYYYTDPITTALGLGNILLYAGIYTPLKPYTIYNTWIGALVGAIPPLMGYTAAKHILHTESLSLSSSSMSNALDVVSSTTTSSSPLMSMSTELWSSFISDPIAISLVSILYFWQLPHFMALSYMYRIDYKRGGFMMVPTVPMVSRGNTNHDVISDNDLGATDSTIQTDCAGVRTANIIVRYAWYLSMVPIFSTAMDVTSSMYLLESILLNAYALRVAYKFSDQQSNQNARNVFLTSLWYLPCTLMLFLLHSKAWDDTTTNDETYTNKNILTQFVSEQIHTIRNRGRELCIHEQAIVKNTGTTTKNMTKDNTDTKEVYGDEGIDGLSEASCPIMIVRKTDPNNIHINMHQATTTAMAAARESSTK